MRSPCCPDPCLNMPTLVAMGLAPELPSAVCSGVNPQTPGVKGKNPCVAGRPCCGPVLLTTFLNGSTYPIPAMTLRVVVSDALPSPFVGNLNPTAIANDTQLLLYLNGQLVLAQANSYPIEGVGSQYQISNGLISAPQIGGGCKQRLERVALPATVNGLTMLVSTQDNAQIGHIVAPTAFSGEASIKSVIGILLHPSEVIATLAQARAVPPGELPALISDGWAVVVKIDRQVLPGYDRVTVKTPGETLLLEDLGESPLRKIWESMRDVGAAPCGVCVGADPGIPINGPAFIVQPERFLPGQAVVSPRVAMPVDVQSDDVVKPGFRLLSAHPSTAVGTIPPSPAGLTKKLAPVK